jgi:hypothetical protein
MRPLFVRPENKWRRVSPRSGLLRIIEYDRDDHFLYEEPMGG